MRRLKLLAVTGMMLILLVECKLRVYLDKVTFKYDASIAILNISIADNRVVNYECEVKHDLPTMDLIIRFGFFQGTKALPLLINDNVNYCKHMQFVKENKWWRIITGNIFNQNSNLPRSCPIAKNTYYLRNYTMDENLLPAFMPRLNFLLYIAYALKNENGANVKFAEIELPGKIQDVQ